MPRDDDDARARDLEDVVRRHMLVSATRHEQVMARVDGIAETARKNSDEVLTLRGEVHKARTESTEAKRIAGDAVRELRSIGDSLVHHVDRVTRATADDVREVKDETKKQSEQLRALLEINVRQEERARIDSEQKATAKEALTRRQEVTVKVLVAVFGSGAVAAMVKVILDLLSAHK